MPSPLVSSTLQATAIAALSNILAQLLSHHRSNTPLEISLPEFLRFLLFTLLTSPPNYLWQIALERTFPGRKLPSPELPRYETIGEDTALAHDVEKESTASLDWRNTFLKWFVDCITLGALWNTAAFLIIMGLLKGRTGAQIGTAVRTETFPIIYASYKIWPLASVFNFTVVPVEKRIVFLSVIGLFWGIFLSLTAAKQ